MFTTFFLGALYLQHVKGYSAFNTGLAFLPSTLTLAVLSLGISARLMRSFGPRALLIPGLATITVALLLMAGLSLVPEDLLKAARVDGASAWQRFYRVTLPLMKPAILVALLFRTLDAFRIFDNIYILTGGGNGTYSVSILGYDNLFRALNLGIGSAISILIFICVAIIAFIFIRIFGAAAPGA